MYVRSVYHLVPVTQYFCTGTALRKLRTDGFNETRSFAITEALESYKKGFEKVYRHDYDIAIK